MNAEEKLFKIATILEKYVAKFEVIDEQPMKKIAQALPILGSSVDVFVDKTKLQGMQNRKFKNRKIIVNARNLYNQFEEASENSFQVLFSQLRKTNAKRKLAKFKKEIDTLYDGMLSGIFNLGRQQERVANKSLPHDSLKKFAEYNLTDMQHFDNVLSSVKDDIALKIETCGSDFQDEDFDEQYQYLRRAFDNHFWKIYSYGNLYQIQKDQTPYVEWRCGQYKDDCGTCKKIAIGDLVLRDANGNAFPYVKDLYGNVYVANDITNYIGMDGLSKFTHEDCRCFLVPRWL